MNDEELRQRQAALLDEQEMLARDSRDFLRRTMEVLERDDQPRDKSTDLVEAEEALRGAVERKHYIRMFAAQAFQPAMVEAYRNWDMFVADAPRVLADAASVASDAGRLLWEELEGMFAGEEDVKSPTEEGR